ncbi:acyl-CoA dehydrogenase family protein [Geodermatophilus sp. URMC 64]
MEFDWSDEQAALRGEIQTFLDRELDHDLMVNEPEIDSYERGMYAKKFAAALNRESLLVPGWPEEWGGTGAGPWDQLILSEELVARGEPRAGQIMNTQWVGPMIMNHGSPEQKEYHLRRIRAGDIVYCQGFSEPEAGSDLASLQTEAVLDGDDYVVRGRKIWTSWANTAEWCILLARTDPDAPKHKGITILLVPLDTPGLQIRSIPALIGDYYFHELVFDNVRVPSSNRLGAENAGWEIVREALANERTGRLRYAHQLVRLDQTIAWAAERSRLDDSATQELLGRAYAAAHAARILVYRTVDEQARGAQSGATPSITRIALAWAEREVAECINRIMGTEGLVIRTAADLQFKDSMMVGVSSGTYEIQLNLIARALALPGGR